MWGCPNPTAYTKDTFHDFIIDGKKNKHLYICFLQMWLDRYDSRPILSANNEINFRKFWGCLNPTAYTKDAFHDYIIDGKKNKQINLLSIDALRYVIHH